MSKDVHAKYSVLIAGTQFSVNEINELLKNGIKVIWFAGQNNGKAADETFGPYKEAGFLELYENPLGIETIIEDGQDIDSQKEVLEDLENGDDQFNLEQFEVEHQPMDRNMIIEAGAGTGKTHVMINRIMYLMHMDPAFSFSKVAMITFTNKATDIMRQRLIKTLDAKYKLTGKTEYLDRIEELSQISISTIHSFFRKVIVEVGPMLGYGTNVQLKSYILEKKELLRDLLDEQYKGRKRVDEVIGLPVHRLERLALDYWEKLDNNGIAEDEICLLSWGDTSDEKARLIQASLKDIFAKVDDAYNDIKYANNAISMKDIIHELSRVINRPELKEYISNNYRYMFVDEFQDSDNVQIQTIAILNRVYEGNLFVVGDIKQSIYRFRGATDDIAFTRLKELLSEQEKERLVKKPLRKNYRTSADVLNEMDAIFSQWGQKGLLHYERDDQLVPQKKKHGIYEQTVIKEGEREKKVIALIRQIQESSEHKKIACLTRRNSQLRTIKKWCEKEKIVCLIRERGSFYGSDAVLDLCALLEAYLYDNEPMYIYNYIMSSYGPGHVDHDALRACGGNKYKLYYALSKEIDSETWERNKADLRNKPVMSVLREIVSTAEPVKSFGIRRKADLLRCHYPEDKALEQAVLDSIQYDADLKKLLQILTDQFSGDFSSLMDLSNFLRLKILTDEQEEQAEIEPIKDIDYVEGYTVHGAKGLEFENVILPYLNDPFYQSFRSEVLLSKDHKSVGWVYREKGCDDIKNDQYDSLLNDEKEEVAKEETRLLYVAMTRAKYGLYCLPVRKNVTEGRPSCWAELLPVEKDDARSF